MTTELIEQQKLCAACSQPLTGRSRLYCGRMDCLHRRNEERKRKKALARGLKCLVCSRDLDDSRCRKFCEVCRDTPAARRLQRPRRKKVTCRIIEGQVTAICECGLQKALVHIHAPIPPGHHSMLGAVRSLRNEFRDGHRCR